ncbi:MAG: polyprenyl synthetase family protein [Candidatus Krumholzibacteria bacterium]|nr:polyprenyl synthetase family protein [Candidatus Krumholzibacteria bacterium]
MDELLPREREAPASLHRAMRYAALGGGKRMRGVFCLEAHRLFGNPHPGDALLAACAVEFLHAYSLVHDDLPALDDDQTRRGRPSCHIAFGEAGAILAGDALQAYAFEILARCSDAPPGNVLVALRLLARTAGSRQLVGGQVADLEAEHSGADRVKVLFIHERKTGALIAASLGIGATLAGCSREALDELMRSGGEIGLAFQIVDDLLDLTGSEEAVGKGLRKDVKKGKMTWPSCCGKAASRETARELVSTAIGRVKALGDAGYLEYLYRLVIDRVS